MARFSSTALLRGAAACLLLAVAAHARAPPNFEATSRIQGNELIREEFASWVATHEKEYVNDVKEYARRFEIFADNLLYIMQHNAKGASYKLGANKFADMTHEEFKATQLGVRPGDTFKPKRKANAVAEFDYHDVVAPKDVDWRAKGAVAPVKNQLQCGSCWSFSTTGSVEGINAIKTGKLVSLSEQELVDCDTTKDHGCNGGLMDFAFDFIVANGGIDTEKDYAYKAVDEKCNIDKESTHVVSIDGHKDVPENDEAALKKAIAMQPVSVAIEADQRDFQLYASGVFDAPCGTALDHGVLAVGYGHQVTANGTAEYYIVKNSWGATWGDGGFIMMKMGVAPSGICGIAMSASYPLKTGPNPKPGPKPGPKPTPAPSPGPVQCDSMHSCPTDTTCCCSMELGNYCFAWGCCPSPEATCCDDHKHCCPKERPVCDVADATCAPAANPLDKVPALKKLPAWLDESAAEAAGLKRVDAEQH